MRIETRDHLSVLSPEGIYLNNDSTYILDEIQPSLMRIQTHMETSHTHDISKPSWGMLSWSNQIQRHINYVSPTSWREIQIWWGQHFRENEPITHQRDQIPNSLFYRSESILLCWNSLNGFSLPDEYEFDDLFLDSQPFCYHVNNTGSYTKSAAE